MVPACQAEAPRDIEVIKAPAGMSEVEFTKATSNRLQTVSFASNREYCGYIFCVRLTACWPRHLLC